MAFAKPLKGACLHPNLFLLEWRAAMPRLECASCDSGWIWVNGICSTASSDYFLLVRLVRPLFLQAKQRREMNHPHNRQMLCLTSHAGLMAGHHNPPTWNAKQDNVPESCKWNRLTFSEIPTCFKESQRRVPPPARRTPQPGGIEKSSCTPKRKGDDWDGGASGK